MEPTIKQIKRLFLLLCLILAGVQSAWAEDELYARINTSTHTMEVHYDGMRLANMTSDEISFLAKEEGFYREQWWYKPDIYYQLQVVEKIIFYPGLQNAPVTSTHNWFKDMLALTTIDSPSTFPTTVTDMSNMFEDCKALTNFDLSDLPVDNVTNMSGMFKGCSKLTNLNLSGWNTAKLTNMNDMFYGCTSLTSLNLSGWTNTMITDMSGLFSNFYSLTSLDLTDFNTSNVTNMSGMFSGSNSLTSIDLSSFNTSNVTNMSGMFRGCKQLTNVIVGNSWDTSNVTDMSNMFANCIALGTLSLNYYNTSNVTNMSGMFKGCSNLSSINYGDNWNTGNVTDMSSMFEDCANFTTINLSKYNTANVTNMSSMFKGCSNLSSFAYGSLNTSHVGDMSYMFDGCSALTSISSLGLSSWNVANVTNMNGIFCGCSSLTSLTLNWYTSAATKMEELFKGCSNLSSISFGTGWDTNNVTSLGGMFEGCSSLTSIDLGSFNTSNVTNMSYMFSGCSSLTTINLTGFNTSNVTGMSYMFSDCSGLTTLDLTGFDTSAATAMNSMFRGCSSLSTIDGISSWNTSNVSKMNYMFSSCSALTSLDLSNWNTSSVRNLEGMFQGCNHLSTITGISKWKTPNLGGSFNDKLKNMFKDCSALTSLDLSGWNTSDVSQMDYMFSGCSNLVTLNLGGWDTSEAEEMDGMFENCSALTTIYVGNGWSVYNVSAFNTLFANCTSLVGGNGTRWNSSHIDKTYARIDAPDTPGYFTETSDESYAVYTPENTTLTFYCDVLRTSHTGTTYDLPTGSNAPGWSATSSAVTSVVFDASFANARPKSTYRWFSDMGKLTTIDGIGNLNTSQVTVMSEMFYGCNQLGNLDLTSLNTSNVTDMSSVFRNCSALTSLDLTGWNTKKVTDMSNMFRECSVLEAIYVDSNWSTQAVTGSNNMFSNCTQLVGGYGTPYDAAHVDMSYAHIDNSASPGYLRDHSQEHNVNLVLVAGVCDKSIEVWNGNTQVGSISQEGGTFYETINNATTLQLRIPNQYLEKITINGKDVTTTLSSTTPDDPDYQGYEFYTVKNLTDVMVIEVQYNNNVPVPFATSSIRFETYNGTGSLKNMKVWFEDGTSISDNIARPVPFGIGWGNMRTISKIEVTMQPDLDNFAYAQQYNTLGTIVDNGDGTYFYTISGENLTSSIIPLYFPTSDHGSVKTIISSKNDFKLGYYFGEWINMEGGFLPEYDQTNTSVLNSDVTVMHYDTHNYQAQAGGYSTGIIFVQVTQGTTFRLTEDGEDCTGDCVWRDANQTFTASPLPISYTCPVAGYYYLLKNVTTDSYIIVDDGTTPLSEIESPFQVVQTITAYGDATLSLRKTDGDVVESVSNGESKHASWEKGTNMQLVVTLPANASAANYEAHLIIDGIDNILTTTTGDGGVLTFNAFDMENVTSSHNITLITRQKGGFTSTDVTQSLLVTGVQVGKAHVFLLDNEGYTVFDDLESDATTPYTTITDSWEDVASARIYVSNVPEGYTFKAYFNGVEITGFTDPNNNGNQVATVDASIAQQNGNWVVNFIKGAGASSGNLVATVITNGITTNFVDFTADRSYWPEGTTSYEFTPGSNLKVVSNSSDNEHVLHYYVNGVDRTEDLEEDGLYLNAVNKDITIEIKSVPLYMKWMLCNTEHGQSNVYFKMSGETYNRPAQGNVVTGSTTTDLGSELRIVLTPDEGYEPLFFYKWQRDVADESLSEEEAVASGLLIKKSDGSYEFKLPASMMANEEEAYFTVIYINPNAGDLDRYDVNRDGHINITDVTVLVNKILHP